MLGNLRLTIHLDDDAKLAVAFLRDRLGEHVRLDDPKAGRRDTLIYGALEIPDDYFDLDEPPMRNEVGQ